MKLIKKFETRRNKQGVKVRFGLYRCPKCEKTVKRMVSNGDRNKTCSHRCQPLKHGDNIKGKRTRLYQTWAGMKSRCFNPKNKKYKYYGGRDITIYEKWKSDYTVFREWALANGYKDNLTIDRIDNNGDYNPDNCQWISKANNNRKASEKFTIGEVVEIRKIINYGKYTRKRIAKAYNVSPGTINNIANNKTYQETFNCVKN